MAARYVFAVPLRRRPPVGGAERWCPTKQSPNSLVTPPHAAAGDSVAACV
jgi:hypothetical protein